jgi:hypothetical protein
MATQGQINLLKKKLAKLVAEIKATGLEKHSLIDEWAEQVQQDYMPSATKSVVANELSFSQETKFFFQTEHDALKHAVKAMEDLKQSYAAGKVWSPPAPPTWDKKTLIDKYGAAPGDIKAAKKVPVMKSSPLKETLSPTMKKIIDKSSPALLKKMMPELDAVEKAYAKTKISGAVKKTAGKGTGTSFSNIAKAAMKSGDIKAASVTMPSFQEMQKLVADTWKKNYAKYYGMSKTFSDAKYVELYKKEFGNKVLSSLTPSQKILEQALKVEADMEATAKVNLHIQKVLTKQIQSGKLKLDGAPKVFPNLSQNSKNYIDATPKMQLKSLANVGWTTKEEKAYINFKIEQEFGKKAAAASKKSATAAAKKPVLKALKAKPPTPAEQALLDKLASTQALARGRTIQEYANTKALAASTKLYEPPPVGYTDDIYFRGAGEVENKVGQWLSKSREYANRYANSDGNFPVKNPKQLLGSLESEREKWAAKKLAAKEYARLQDLEDFASDALADARDEGKSKAILKKLEDDFFAKKKAFQEYQQKVFNQQDYHRYIADRSRVVLRNVSKFYLPKPDFDWTDKTPAIKAAKAEYVDWIIQKQNLGSYDIGKTRAMWSGVTRNQFTSLDDYNYAIEQYARQKTFKPKTLAELTKIYSKNNSWELQVVQKYKTYEKDLAIVLKDLRAKTLEESFGEMDGLPHWRKTDSIKEFLNKKHPGWKVTSFYEDDGVTVLGKKSFHTSVAGMAKPVIPKKGVPDPLAAPTDPVFKAKAKAVAGIADDFGAAPKGYKDSKYFYNKGIVRSETSFTTLPKTEAFYLPKKGAIQFDDDLKMKFAKYQLGDKKPMNNLMDYKNRVFKGYGYPDAKYEAKIVEFLNSQQGDWTSFTLSDGNAKFYTRVKSKDVLLPAQSAKAKALTPVKPQITLGKPPVPKNNSFSLKGLQTEATPKGYLETPVYRGLKIKTEGKSGAKFYSMSREYARAYSIDNPNILDKNFSKASRDAARKVAKPVNLKKYYVPKKGFISFAKDEKLQSDFANWYAKENLDKYTSQKVLYNQAMKAFNTPTGNPHWRFDDSIHKYLTERQSGWTSTMLFEDDTFTQSQLNPLNMKVKKIEGQNTIMTRDGSVARKVDDLTKEVIASAPTNPAPVFKSTIQKQLDDYMELWRGTDVVEKEAGQYLSASKGYAQRYANFNRNVPGKTATLTKYYLPKEGFVNFKKGNLAEKFVIQWNIDNETPIAEKAARFFASKKTAYGKTLAEIERNLINEEIGKKFVNGNPRYQLVKSLGRFLDKEKPDWKYIKLWEGDGFDDASDVSFYTRTRGIAKTEEQILGQANPESPVITTPAVSSFVELEKAYPLQGSPMKEWVAKISKKDARLVDDVLRNAWKQGSTLAQARKALEAVFAQTRNQTMALTRTYYGHMAASARDQLWKANSDLVTGVTWDSILDNRTTINICAPRDQKLYDMKGNPVGHSLPWLGGPGNAHWQCRSHSFPSIKGITRHVDRQAIGSGKDYERGDNVTRTGKVRKKTQDSLKKGIYKDTTVRQGTDYSDWLKKQSPAFQDDVLGVQKAEAFRNGTFKLGDKFVAQNPKTLAGVSVPKVTQATPRTKSILVNGKPPANVVKLRGTAGFVDSKGNFYDKKGFPLSEYPIGGKAKAIGLKPLSKPPAKPPAKPAAARKVKPKTPAKAKSKIAAKPLQKPPVKMATRPILPWSDPTAKKWAEQSMESTPQTLKEKLEMAIKKFKVAHTSDKAQFEYFGQKIQMGKKRSYALRDGLAMDDKNTFLHESGHALDADIGGHGILYKFRSGAVDFKTARAADEVRLIANNQINDAKFSMLNQKLIDMDLGDRIDYIKIMASRLDINFDEFVDFVHSESGILPGSFQMPGHIGAQVRLAKMLKSIEINDAESFLRLIAGYDTGDLIDSNGQWRTRRNNLSHFSDLIGATTKNDVMPSNRYPGHSDDYYQTEGMAETEMFANFTSLYGGPNGKMWGKILPNFVSASSKLYKEIVGL